MISVLIFTSILAMCPFQVSAINNSISEVELNSSAGSYLKDKASAILSPKARQKCENAQSEFQTYASNVEKELIESYRERLAQRGETYKDSNTELKILSQYNGDDGNLYVTAQETTMLTIAENNVETGYSANHTFVYTLKNGEWELIEDRELEPTGLLPLYQANQFVYSENDDISECREVAIDVIEDESGVPEIEAATTKPETIEGDKVSMRSGYNYQAMAAYLEQYWLSYNTAYRNFDGEGGDCTNFVSQALKAGGWEDKSGWYQNANYWWYSSANQTYSWINVDYLGTFARSSGRCTMLDNVWKLRIGDFLQVKRPNSTSKAHSMMVSYFSNGTPYFTYHSSNRYRRSMNQVIEDWPGCTFYAYRT